MRNLRWLLAVTVISAPIPVSAQELDVTVRTAFGNPLRFATVALLRDTTPAGRSAPLATRMTNDSGEARFDTVPGEARHLRVMRVGYPPATIELGASQLAAHRVDVLMEDFQLLRARTDSIRAARHAAGVAIARSRARHWVCTSADSVAHSRARAAYRTFAGGYGGGMRKVASEYGMPDDPAAFIRMFTTPLTSAECVRFAEGLDRSTNGLETDTLEVYRFGKAYYLPWYGGYEGGFANADGKVLAVFIVPD